MEVLSHQRVASGWRRDRRVPSVLRSTLWLVFERELKTSAIGHHLFALNPYVELGDLGDAQVMERSASRFHGVLGGILPRRWTRADDIDHAIDATLCRRSFLG